jgi:hypothetical protein
VPDGYEYVNNASGKVLRVYGTSGEPGLYVEPEIVWSVSPALDVCFPVHVIAQKNIALDELQTDGVNDQAKADAFIQGYKDLAPLVQSAMADYAAMQKAIKSAMDRARGGDLRIGDYHPVHYNMLQSVAEHLGNVICTGRIFDKSPDWTGADDVQLLLDGIDSRFRVYDDFMALPSYARPETAEALIRAARPYYLEYVENNRISEPDITKFSVGDTQGVIDADAGIVTLAFPEGTDLATLPAPVIETNGWTKAEYVAGSYEDGTVIYKVYPYEESTGIAYDGVDTAEEGGYGYGIDLSRQWAILTTAGAPVNKVKSFGFAVGEDWYGGAVSESAKTITVELPEGTAVTALTPVIEHTGERTNMDGGAVDFTAPKTLTIFNDTAKTQESYAVTVKRLNTASDSRIRAFRYYSQYAEIDEAKGEITLNVPSAVGRNFAPTVELYSPLASVSPASGVVQDFTSPVKYTVAAKNGSKSVYTVTVAIDGETASNPYIPQMEKLLGDIIKSYPKTLSEDWEWMNVGLHERTLRGNASQLPTRLDLRSEIGAINRKIMTDYARVIMMVTALGIDARRLDDYGGPFQIGGADVSDLVAALYNFDSPGTINGPAYSLIALDMGNYAIPDDAVWTRERLLEAILDHTYGSDGFGIDMVAMLMQAIAPYADDPVYGERVSAKLAQGVRLITGDETASGVSPMTYDYGFGGALFGARTSESASQVICALSSIGIDVFEDPRFTADNGNRGVIPSWLAYAVTGGFEHLIGGGWNTMATYEACYTLQWYLNFMEGGGSGNPYWLYYHVFDFSGSAGQEDVDKKSLEGLIAEAKAVTDLNVYTSASRMAFVKALNEAETAMLSASATQKLVDDAAIALESAISGLAMKPATDKAGLDAAIITASKLKAYDYTADSWQLFAKALADAKAAYDDEEATQLLIDSGAEQLLVAIDNLVKAPKEAVDSKYPIALSAELNPDNSTINTNRGTAITITGEPIIGRYNDSDIEASRDYDGIDFGYPDDYIAYAGVISIPVDKKLSSGDSITLPIYLRELAVGDVSANIALSLALPGGYVWEDDISGGPQDVIVITYVAGDQGEYALPTYNENEDYGWQRFIYKVELVTEGDITDGDGFLVQDSNGHITAPISGVSLRTYDADTADIVFTSYSYKSELEERVLVRPYLTAGARIAATGGATDAIAADGLSANMYLYGGNSITVTDKNGGQKTYAIVLDMPWRFFDAGDGEDGYSDPRLIVNGVQTPLVASGGINYRDIAAGASVGLTVMPQAAGLAIESVTLRKLRGDTVLGDGDLNIAGNTVYFTMPDECVAVESIVFKADTRTLYSVDAQASKYTQYDDMGSVTVTNAGDSYGLTQAEAGTPLVASARPSSSLYIYNFEFVRWDAEGVTLDDNTANPMEFTMPAGNVSLTAVFRKAGTEVTYGASISGAATITPRALIGAATEISRDAAVTDVLKPGALVHFARSSENLTVYAFEGYFDANGVQYVPDADGYIEIGNEPMTVIARYRARVARRLAVAIDADSLGMGSVGVRLNGVAAAADGMAVEGQSVALTATPAARYKFKEWQVVSAPEGFALYPGAGSETVSFTMPASAVSVKAVFERDEAQKSGENTITYMELADSSGNPIGATWRVGQNWTITLPADTPAATLNGLAALRLTVTHSEYATVKKTDGHDDAQGGGKWSDGVASGLALGVPAIFMVTAENGDVRAYMLTIEKAQDSDPGTPGTPGNPNPNNPGETTGDLNEDQLIALESLRKVLASCPRSDYTDAEWQQLNAIYASGQEKIKEAGSYAAIQRALADTAQSMTAVPASRAPAYITVAVSMEKFSIDGKYIIEPILVTAPRGSRASAVITNVIKDKYPGVALPWKMTGSVDSDFYLSYVWDPAYNGDASWAGYLGEFDEGPQSGWMYCVNNSFPGVGAAAWTLRNSDVMRWQYTCTGLGADIGADNEAWSSGPSVPVANKDALTWRIAEINTNGKKADYGDSYDKAITVLSRISSTQAEVNAALAALQGGGSGGGSDIKDSETPLGAMPEIVEKVEVKAEVSGGAAAAEVSDADVKAAVESASKNGSTAVALVVSGAQDATSVSVALSKTSLNEIKYAGFMLVAETEVASLALGQSALDTVAAAAGETVTIAAEIGDNNVIDLTITVGDTPITALGGTATVSLPHTPDAAIAPEDYDLLTVYYLAEDGSMTEMKGARYDAATGSSTFATEHLGKFKVSEWISPFDDIAKGEWYYKAARFAYSNDLLTGTTDTTFAPQTTLTRAMLITVLARDAGVDTTGGETWYSKAADWGMETGLTDGTNMNGEITREQFATILYRYAQLSAHGVPTSGDADISGFADAGDVSEWAREAMEWAVANGLVTGRSAAALAPRGTATRAEAAMLLQRYLENVA